MTGQGTVIAYFQVSAKKGSEIGNEQFYPF